VTIPLVGNIQTNDARLDRLPEFDDRSRAFSVRGILTATEEQRPIRSMTWTVPVSLDQGSEGACVGFSWAHEIAARPFADRNITDDIALGIYRWARQNDEWPGEDYDGTSVLAGAKAVTNLGLLKEYRWGFNAEDVHRAVSFKGPAVMGINWYTGMMSPESDGRIRPTGAIEGGHAILYPRVRSPIYRIKTLRQTAWLYNSWGPGWGPEGPWCYLTWEDFERLMDEQGEACVPVQRSKAPKPSP
jgi:hypothetical protein